MASNIRKKSNQIYFYVNSQDYLTFSAGNRKLSSSILIFNLPAGSRGSCPMDCPSCYARKAERIYQSVRESRENNMKMLQHHGEQILVNAIARILSYAPHIKAIRFHESGDIFSDNYASALKTAAHHAQNRGIKTWLYTKTEHNSISLYPANVVESILPDGDINFGSRDYVADKNKRFKAPICPATQGKKTICGEDCTICQTSRLVLFVEH